MLELRQYCENCGKNLPNDSDEALICSYECTYCKECVDTVLKNVCPNCDGGFEKRPTRPNAGLEKYPMRADKIIKPVLENNYLELNRFVDPRKR